MQGALTPYAKKASMKKPFFSAVILASAMALGPAAQAAVVGVDFSDGILFSVGTFNNVGWSFQVTSSVAVDGLGVFDEVPEGLVNPHTVGLWDASGHLLRQTTVTNAGAAQASASGLGHWLFEDVPLITLGAGSYVIGAFYADSDLDSVPAFATDLTLAANILYLTSRASTGTGFAEPGVYGAALPGVFGPNFRIASITEVPEPASLALIGWGLAAAAAVRRRQRRTLQRTPAGMS